MTPASTGALLEAGQDAYKRKEYGKALQLFTSALDLSRKSGGEQIEILSILDLRITTYVKVGNLDLARDDAKSMIRINRADARGYLRCGQLFRLEEDYKSALKWYDHGIKNVPSSDGLREYLQVQRKKTDNLAVAQLKLSNPTDPSTKLPAEVFHMVISYFEYRQVVAVLRVSRNWSKLICGLKPLVDTLDYSDARRPLTYAMMKASLRRLSKWPKIMLLDNLTGNAAGFLDGHLGRWVNHSTLECLVVKLAGDQFSKLPFHRYNLKTIAFGKRSNIAASNVQDILKSCRLLESATFASITARGFVFDLDVQCPNLKKLHLEVSETSAIIPESTAQLPVSAFECFPNLTKLTYIRLEIGSNNGATEDLDFSHMRDLLHLNLSFGSCPGHVIPPRSLEVWQSSGQVFFPARGRPQNRLPNLREVTIEGCVNPPLLISAACSDESKGCLTDLTLNSDHDLYPSLIELLHIDGLFRRLRSLEVTCQYLTDDYTDLFTAEMPDLERLYLSNAPITGVFLAGLLTAPSSRLTTLHLFQCFHISPDAIEWARKRGVTVRVFNGDHGTRGTRWIRETY